MHTHTAEFPLHEPPVARRAPRPALRTSAAAGAALLLLLSCIATAARLERARPAGPSVAAAAAGRLTSADRRPSHAGRYHARVVHAEVATAGTGSAWIIGIESHDGRALKRAHIASRIWMPESGERSPARAAVRDLGGGRYRVDGIRFTRPGWWNVALEIESAAGVDSVAFNVIVEPPRERAREGGEARGPDRR